MHLRNVPAAAMLLAGLALAAGCAGQQQPGALAPPGATASPSAAPTPTVWASVPPYTEGEERRGPAKPAVGTAYPFDLYVHCTGEFTRFGGRHWHSDSPPGDLSPRPGSNGNRKITGFVAGTMELLDADTARFVIDTRYVETAQPVVLYQLALQTPPGCM
ncbi:hypothetical protein [Catellatospora vulcania]|uniref:hypothetical protein n=1 Tax=Catellatospora vulcania TaxID=1460450 RepID=UPI0012D3B652|nr:hypothetical protein [Catellatospora vulcania]